MQKQTQRITSFQGLRGYAILLVFVSHYPFVLNSAGGNALGWAGALGVEIFILLSGYLAAKQFDEGELSTGIKSLKRKILKFYPLHILTLLSSIYFAFENLFIQRHLNSWIKLGLNALLLHSWGPVSSVYFSFNAVSWYLCLTVFFAAIAPFVMKVVVRIRGFVWAFLAVLIFAVQVMWCFCAENSSAAHWLVYICPVARLLDYALGGGIYVMAKSWKQHKRLHNPACIYLLGAVAIAANALVLYISRDSQSEMYSVCTWTIPVSLLLLSLGSSDTMKMRGISAPFENKVILFLGNISFEIFLIHYQVLQYGTMFVDHFEIEKSPVFGMFLAGITLIVCWAINKCMRHIQKKTIALNRG